MMMKLELGKITFKYYKFMRVDILMILKTLGIEFDDRVRKEAKSFQKLNQKIKIIVVENSNKKSKGVSSFGIDYVGIRLISRMVFPHKKFLSIKLFEMYFAFIWQILKYRPKVLYLHNLEMIGLVYFGAMLKKAGIIEKIIWDHHELPAEKRLKNPKYFRYLKSACIKSDIIVGANNERINYLTSELGLPSTNFYAIENVVDSTFSKFPVKELPEPILEFLNGSSYVFSSSGAEPGRYLDELLIALSNFSNLKIIVIGPYNENIWNSLVNKYGTEIRRKVYFTGLVKQLEVANFLDHALMSVIFYASTEPNLTYCAPNRLYQALSRKIPVLTGNNPPLKNVVDKFQVGYSIDSDGSDVNQVILGIQFIIDNHKQIKTNFEKVTDHFVWEKQENIFRKMLNSNFENI